MTDDPIAKDSIHLFVLISVLFCTFLQGCQSVCCVDLLRTSCVSVCPSEASAAIVGSRLDLSLCITNESSMSVTLSNALLDAMFEAATCTLNDSTEQLFQADNAENYSPNLATDMITLASQECIWVHFDSQKSNVMSTKCRNHLVAGGALEITLAYKQPLQADCAFEVVLCATLPSR